MQASYKWFEYPLSEITHWKSAYKQMGLLKNMKLYDFILICNAVAYINYKERNSAAKHVGSLLIYIIFQNEVSWFSDEIRLCFMSYHNIG